MKYAVCMLLAVCLTGVCQANSELKGPQEYVSITPALTLSSPHYSAALQVKARVVTLCLIRDKKFKFHDYDPLSHSGSQFKGELLVRCMGDARLKITLSPKGGADEFVMRAIQGGEELNYQLLNSAGQNWVPGQSYPIKLDDGKIGRIHLNGEIPPGQFVPDGIYRQYLLAKITF
ncbi:spore coat protein U domain-containing protein [Dongshaea marina]|uniref:spore coat protein U domain-containing protein n=1 Tax=Dongshaea marina TaxID=2047966 RepID=UPI00131F3E18|nr:spore coat protein U domain-containing protein [Dongshaea marina]